jgi:hypothetical protein
MKENGPGYVYAEEEGHHTIDQLRHGHLFSPSEVEWKYDSKERNDACGKKDNSKEYENRADKAYGTIPS